MCMRLAKSLRFQSLELSELAKSPALAIASRRCRRPRRSLNRILSFLSALLSVAIRTGFPSGLSCREYDGDGMRVLGRKKRKTLFSFSFTLNFVGLIMSSISRRDESWCLVVASTSSPSGTFYHHRYPPIKPHPEDTGNDTM